MKDSIREGIQTLEFESREVSFVRITKPFRTPSGDMIKAVPTDGGTVIMKRATGKPNNEVGEVVIINMNFSIGDIGNWLKKLWDLGKKVLFSSSCSIIFISTW